LRSVTLGGGSASLFHGHLDVAAIGAHLHNIVAQAAFALPVAGLLVELGRFLVGEAGVYVARVVDEKFLAAVFLVADGGLPSLAASGTSVGDSQNYRSRSERGKTRPREVASVVGPLHASGPRRPHGACRG
jgi:diaminopimelate decarboxylase